MKLRVFDKMLPLRAIGAIALAFTLNPAAASQAVTPEELRNAILADQTVIAASGISCKESNEAGQTLDCIMKLKSDDVGIDAMIEADGKTRNVKTATFLGAGGAMVDPQKAMQIATVMLVVVGRTIQAFNPEIVRDQRGKIVVALVKGMNREENSESVGGVTYSLTNGIFLTFSAERLSG